MNTPTAPIENLSGRLDVAASRIAGRLIYHKVTEMGLGDLAEGLVELATPFLQQTFADLFGTKQVSFPSKLTEAVTKRLINGMDSRVAKK